MPGPDAPQGDSSSFDELSPLQAEGRQVQMMVLAAPLGIGVTKFYTNPRGTVNANVIAEVLSHLCRHLCRKPPPGRFTSTRRLEWWRRFGVRVPKTWWKGGRSRSSFVSTNTVQCPAMSWNCHGCDLQVACEFCESCSEHCVARLPNEIDAHCVYVGRMLARSTVVARPVIPAPGATIVAPATNATDTVGCRALAPLF